MTDIMEPPARLGPDGKPLRRHKLGHELPPPGMVWGAYGELLTFEELCRLQGTRPMTIDEWAQPGIFESDEEVEEFIRGLYNFRRTGVWEP